MVDFDAAAIEQLQQLTGRTMRLQASIQDGMLWLGDSSQTIEIGMTVLRENKR